MEFSRMEETLIIGALSEFIYSLFKDIDSGLLDNDPEVKAQLLADAMAAGDLIQKIHPGYTEPHFKLNTTGEGSILEVWGGFTDGDPLGEHPQAVHLTAK